jgi:hypothetical protein
MGAFLVGYGLLLITGVTNLRHLIDNIIASYLLGWALYGMFARVPLAEVGTRFLLTTGSLVMCWALAEGAVLLGIVDYRTFFGAYEPGNPLSIAGRQFDPELIWRHDPYYRYEAAYQGNLGAALCIPPDPARKVVIRYDKYGFRNTRDLQESDVVVIGDSYMEGYLTSEAKLVTARLSDLLGKPVANLGHSGYGPQQELVVLKRFGLPLKPKVVIWTFFEGNDFAESDEYDIETPRSHNGYWQDFWFRSLTRNVTAFMFRPPAKPCTPNEEILDLRADFTGAGNQNETVFFAPTEVEAPSEKTLRKAFAPIVEAAKLCRQQNIRFLVAFIPEKFRVYHDLRTVSLAAGALGQWRVSDVPDQLRQILMESEPRVEFVDLTPALKDASRSGIATYLPDDTHWTDEGNGAAAETIHRSLLQSSIR